jgi:transcriptional regulator with XRE-family HTH domain
MTQAQLAKKLGTSQSRLARIESADRSVSIDLLVRSLLEMGASRRDLARLIGKGDARGAA